MTNQAHFHSLNQMKTTTKFFTSNHQALTIVKDRVEMYNVKSFLLFPVFRFDFAEIQEIMGLLVSGCI